MADTIELTDMAYGGNAIGRHEGKVIFVPYGIAGEKVQVEIEQDKGRFAQAKIVEILEASESRVIPRCPHFGVCGGCHWQHMEYAVQRVFKQQIVREQLRRVGGLKEVVVHPTIASPDPWYYRSHVSFHMTESGKPGFVTLDNRGILPIDECHIIRPELLEMVAQLPEQPLNRDERLRLQVGSDSRERMSAVVKTTFDDTDSQNNPASSAKVHYTIHGRNFQVTAGSFFQVNLKQAETLVNLVLENLNLQGNERVLDIYSGVGLFTAFIAEHARHVTAIEASPLAVQDAKVNLAGFQNVEIIEGKAEHILAGRKQTYDAVVTDPPRTGMKSKALEAIIHRKPSKIVYVSCDPATLARDARKLVESGYHLIEVQPVDMFPQTYHIESVAVFTR